MDTTHAVESDSFFEDRAAAVAAAAHYRRGTTITAPASHQKVKRDEHFAHIVDMAAIACRV